MGGVTPKLAIPYPTGTDRVMDGDNAMQALAEAVEREAYTGAYVADIAIVPNLTYLDNTKVIRRMGIVYVLINVHFTAQQLPGTQLGTVPVGYRPMVSWRVQAHKYVRSQSILTSIRADGQWLLDTTVEANEDIYAQASYPVPTAGAVILGRRDEAAPLPTDADPDDPEAAPKADDDTEGDDA